MERDLTVLHLHSKWKWIESIIIYYFSFRSISQCLNLDSQEEEEEKRNSLISKRDKLIAFAHNLIHSFIYFIYALNLEGI